jgi:hypothetical protein
VRAGAGAGEGAVGSHLVTNSDGVFSPAVSTEEVCLQEWQSAVLGCDLLCLEVRVVGGKEQTRVCTYKCMYKC